jgi:hypothetical protein
MRRTRWRGAVNLVAGMALLSGSGCRKEPERADSLATRPDTIPTSLARPLASPNAAILVEAESLYTFGRERPQMTIDDRGFPGPYVADDSLPRMWIATATLKDSTHRPYGRILARIRSARAYPKAGIDSGYNYVWRNTWKADSMSALSWETKIIPRDPLKKPYLLTRDPRKHEYTHGEAKEPRLVRVKVHSMGFGACFDDPICPTGHCGYF